MKYDISLIVPFYNVAQYIERCATSLLEQRMTTIEYIFVDDGSTDGSMAVLKNVIERYCSRLSDIKLISHIKNTGLPSARRDGLRESSAKYVLFCDGDDWIEREMTSVLFAEAEKHDADIVACNIVVDKGSSKRVLKYPYTFEDRSVLKSLYLVDGVYSSLCNKLVRKSLFTDNEIQPVEGNFMWEDFLISFRLRFYSKKTIIVPIPYYHYMINRGLSTSSYSEVMIQQQMFCADYFRSFFETYYPELVNEYAMAIRYMEFQAKLGYFAKNETLNLTKWLTVYPESNKYILHYISMPLVKRLLLYLGVHHFPGMASYIYRKLSTFRDRI